jgi:hypothetical protein
MEVMAFCDRRGTPLSHKNKFDLVNHADRETELSVLRPFCVYLGYTERRRRSGIQSILGRKSRILARN